MQPRRLLGAMQAVHTRAPLRLGENILKMPEQTITRSFRDKIVDAIATEEVSLTPVRIITGAGRSRVNRASDDVTVARDTDER